MKKILKTMAIIGVSTLIFSCGNVEKKKPVVKLSQHDKDSIAEFDKAEKIAKIWAYDEHVDKMTDKKILFASCVSINKLNFEFPYEGGSTFTLVIRKKNGSTDSYLSVDKGQFMSTFSAEKCKIKFDDKELENYTFNGADDGSSDIIFFNNTKRLIKGLKEAKKLKIEVPFYNAGKQVVEFDVEGLVWE